MQARVLSVAVASLVVISLPLLTASSAPPTPAPGQECLPVIGPPSPAPYCRPASGPPASPAPLPVPPPDDGVNGPEAGGFVKPDETNTGVPDGVNLVPLTPQNVPYPGDTVDGDTLTITTPDAVYEGFDIPYRIRNKAHGTVIRNSWIRGGAAAESDTALVSNDGVQSDGTVPLLYIERSTLIPDHPSAHIDGVRGSNLALRGLEISQVVDGVHVHGTTDKDDPNAGHIMLVGNWIHDLVELPDPDQSDNITHSDGLQAVGGSRIGLFGNRIDGHIQNAAIMIKPDRNAISDVVAVANWMGGGGCTVNVAEIGEAIPPLQVYSLNEFGKGTTRNKDCAIVVSEETEPHTLARGNRWDTGDLPYPNVIPASGTTGLYWDDGLQSWIFDPDRAIEEGTWNQERVESLQRVGAFLGVDLKEIGQKLATVPPSALPGGTQPNG